MGRTDLPARYMVTAMTVETTTAEGVQGAEALQHLNRAITFLVLQLSFRFQSQGALAIYHGEQGLMVDV